MSRDVLQCAAALVVAGCRKSGREAILLENEDNGRSRDSRKSFNTL